MSLLFPWTTDLGFTLSPLISRRRRQHQNQRRRQLHRPPWRRLFSLNDDMWNLGTQLENLQDENDNFVEDMNGPETTRTLTRLALTVPRQQRQQAVTDTEMTTMSPSEEVNQGQDKYIVSIPLGDMPAENLNITCKDRVLTIDAKKEEKSEDGNCRLYQEYTTTRKFTLPDNVQVKDVKSHLTADGVLKIEAPLPPQHLEAPKQPKAIPIQVENSSHPQQAK